MVNFFSGPFPPLGEPPEGDESRRQPGLPIWSPKISRAPGGTLVIFEKTQKNEKGLFLRVLLNNALYFSWAIYFEKKV